MNFPIKTAWRYIFSKKSTNAIHIISGVTVFGIAVGTAALLLVLAVFNGFESLLGDLFGFFNPDIKVEAKEGKFFAIEEQDILKIKKIPGVKHVSATIEEVAFLEYESSQDFGTIKGVDSSFHLINHIDSTIVDGRYLLSENGRNMVVLGQGLAMKLSMHGIDPFKSVTIYMPVDNKRSSMGKPFRSRLVGPAGLFSIQQEVDIQYALSNLTFVQELLKLPGHVSAIEIGMEHREASAATIIQNLERIMGESYTYKDRYQQNEAFFKIMRLERWMFYAIISLAMILVAFNMIGSLWMNVLEKRNDIALLKSVGLEDRGIFKIFFLQGTFLLTLGILGGILIAILIYVLHKQYGLVPIPDGFAVDRYPLEFKWSDFPVVAFTVLAIGSLAAWFPAKKAMGVKPIDIRK